MDLNKLMAEYFKHIKHDKKLHRNIKKFRFIWENRNRTHIDFLSSNLIGVHPIRYTEDDDYELFKEVLDIDKDMLQERLYDVKGIYKERKVTSNVTYVTCLYLMHEEMKNKRYNEEYINDLYFIMVYKMMSSIITHYFKFSLDEDVAYSVYEKLNNRFLIKRLGSWREVFIYRADDVHCSKGLHCKRIKELSGDSTGLAIADIQGRYRSIVKELYVIITDVLENNERRAKSSLNGTGHEGEDVVPDIDNLNKSYYTYITSIIGNERDFVNKDVLTITGDLFPNLVIADLKHVLENISNMYNTNPTKIDKLIKTSMEANLAYLHRKSTPIPYDANIIQVVKTLKGLWSASKVKDKNLIEAKKLTLELSASSGYTTNWRLVSLGMAVGLYIFIRSIIKDKL